MSYFMVRGCATLFDSREEADRKALELANEMLQKTLIVNEVNDEFDYESGYEIHTTNSLRLIKSPQELKDLAIEFDYILNTSVQELFVKEELLPE